MLKTCCGTPSFMAPEVCQRKEYCGYASDVWSFGVIIYILLTGQQPFRGTSERDLFSKISKAAYQKLPDFLDFDTKKFIEKILVADPEKRPKAAEINADRWLMTKKTIQL